MPVSEADFLKSFYQELIDKPLDPAEDGERYVPLYDDRAIFPSDPVKELQATIEWSPISSAQLFSGFRGTGKSTELRRLRQQLRSNGSVVVLCDMQHYMNMSTSVDVSDFLLAAAGAFGDELARDESLMGENIIREGYWTRFTSFLTRTRVNVTDLGLSVGAGGGPATVSTDIRANLKSDPTFRQLLQERLKGHLGALVADVHAFFAECVKALRRRSGDDQLRVVMLLDSVEQIRGVSTNAGDVAASLETLFFSHADKLRIPSLHVVYAVPPWLKIKVPGLSGLYSGAQLIPCIKVRDRDGKPCKAGLDELEHVIRERGDWRRLFGQDRSAIDELLLASGGYLRDLFRLIQTVLRLARHGDLPVKDSTRRLAMDEVRNSYLPIPNDDVRWLHRIRRTKSVQLDGQERLPDLSRFFDTHLVLTYRNGDEWVDVHPLVADVVGAQFKLLELQAESELQVQAPEPTSTSR